MKASHKRKKGQVLERRVAKRLVESGLDITATRMPLSGSIKGLESDIMTILPFSIECKNQETWSVTKYMEQSAESCKDGEVPVVIMSKNRLPDPYVVMLFEDWIALCKLAKDSGGLR